MSLGDLKKTFEKRRFYLANLLRDAELKGLDLGKQHQLYGAIKEIDNLLEAISFYREKEIQEKEPFSLGNPRRSKRHTRNIAPQAQAQIHQDNTPVQHRSPKEERLAARMAEKERKRAEKEARSLEKERIKKEKRERKKGIK